MVIRICKSLLVLMIGIFAVLVGYNNIVDYGSNFEFVRHVMGMDTTFPDNNLMGRAITSSALHHVAYWLIIAGELITGMLCLLGGICLLRSSCDSANYTKAKTIAVIGLTIGFAVWFFGFMTVGAEWFLMWQSKTWNGQQSAFRFIACIGIVLIVLLQPEEDDNCKILQK